MICYPPAAQPPTAESAQYTQLTVGNNFFCGIIGGYVTCPNLSLLSGLRRVSDALLALCCAHDGCCCCCCWAGFRTATGVWPRPRRRTCPSRASRCSLCPLASPHRPTASQSESFVVLVFELSLRFATD